METVFVSKITGPSCGTQVHVTDTLSAIMDGVEASLPTLPLGCSITITREVPAAPLDEGGVTVWTAPIMLDSVVYNNQ